LGVEARGGGDFGRRYIAVCAMWSLYVLQQYMLHVGTCNVYVVPSGHIERMAVMWFARVIGL